MVNYLNKQYNIQYKNDIYVVEHDNSSNVHLLNSLNFFNMDLSFGASFCASSRAVVAAAFSPKEKRQHAPRNNSLACMSSGTVLVCEKMRVWVSEWESEWVRVRGC